jgi:hypothetical protein
MPVPATVGISDAKKVIAHLSKMTQSGSAAFISALPIHAQLGLIAAYNLEKEKRKAKDPTLNDLHARYKALAQSIGVQSEEFAKVRERILALQHNCSCFPGSFVAIVQRVK